MISWLNRHKFETHLGALALMIVTSIGLFFASRSASPTLISGMLIGFVIANLLAILIK